MPKIPEITDDDHTGRNRANLDKTKTRNKTDKTDDEKMNVNSFGNIVWDPHRINSQKKFQNNLNLDDEIQQYFTSQRTDDIKYQCACSDPLVSPFGEDIMNFLEEEKFDRVNNNSSRNSLIPLQTDPRARNSDIHDQITNILTNPSLENRINETVKNGTHQNIHASLEEAQSLARSDQPAQSAQPAQFYEVLPSTLPLQSFFAEEMEKVNRREKEKNHKNEQIEQNNENKKKDKKRDKNNNNNSNNQFTGLMTMDNILHLYHTITLPNYYPKSVREVGNNENNNTSESDRRNDRNVIYFPKLSDTVLKYRDQQAYYQEQRTVEENTQFYQAWVDKWGNLDDNGEGIYGVSDEEDPEDHKSEGKNNNKNDTIDKSDEIMVEKMIETSLLRKKGGDLEHNIDHKHYKFKTHTPTREELKQTQEMHSMYTLYTILLSIALGILIIFSILFLWMSSFSVLCFIRQVSNNQDLNFSCFKNGKVTTILLFIFGLLPTGVILFLGVWNSFYYFLRRFGCAQPLKEFHF
jgi:hypothetical protein